MRRSLRLLLAAAALVVSACGGGGSAGGDTDPLARGRGIFSDHCALCHGTGGGGGVGPPLADVRTTFPSCTEQVRWITLGSSGWEREVGPTYGAPARPVEGPMPSFSATLDDGEIRVVAAWVRTRFGGDDPAAAVSDCGVDEDG